MPQLSLANLCYPVHRRQPFTAEGWLFELKHGGVRTLVRKSSSSVELQSRNGQSMTKALPDIVTARCGHRSAMSSSMRSMRRLQVIEDAAARRPAALIIFDVLQAEGKDLRVLRLHERKAWLDANVTPRADCESPVPCVRRTSRAHDQ